MTPNGTAPIKYATTCRLCKQQFSHGSIDVPIIGEKPQPGRPERVVKFVMALAKHLHDKHRRDTSQEMGITIQDFSGLLIINYYETTDPGLQRLTDTIRGEIHKRTQKNFVNDDAILDLVSRIGLDSDQEKTVAELMKGMRDAYEERGQFSAQNQGERRIQLV